VPPIDPNATHGNAAICRREYANLVAGGNNVVNFLGLDHSVYGKIKNNPGEVVALIKTMLDLEAKGNEVDWRKNKSIYICLAVLAQIRPTTPRNRQHLKH
jgi:hypothetical protein